MLVSQLLTFQPLDNLWLLYKMLDSNAKSLFLQKASLQQHDFVDRFSLLSFQWMHSDMSMHRYPSLIPLWLILGKAGILQKEGKTHEGKKRHKRALVEHKPANCACSLLTCASCRSASCAAAASCFRRSISFFCWAVSSSCSCETCAVAAASSSVTLACSTEPSGKKGKGTRECEEAPELFWQKNWEGDADLTGEVLGSSTSHVSPNLEVTIIFLPHYCELFGCSLPGLTRKLHKANHLLTASIHLTKFSWKA